MDSWAKIQQLPDDKLVEALDAAGPHRPRRGHARNSFAAVRSRAISCFAEARLRRARRRGRLAGHRRARSRTGTRTSRTIAASCSNDASPDVRRLAVDALGLHAKPGDAACARGAHPKCSATRNRPCGGSRRWRSAAWVATAPPSSLVNHYQADEQGRRVPQGRLPARHRTARQAGHRRAPGAGRIGGDKERDIAVEAFLGLRTKPAADALPELLAAPGPEPTTSARRWFARTRTTSSIRRCRSTRSWRTSHRRPNEPLEVVRAALDVFAASGDAERAKARQLVLGLLDKPDDDMRYAAIKAVEDLRIGWPQRRKLIEIVRDSAKRESERTAAVKALRRVERQDAPIAPIKTLLDRQGARRR